MLSLSMTSKCVSIFSLNHSIITLRDLGLLDVVFGLPRATPSLAHRQRFRNDLWSSDWMWLIAYNLLLLNHSNWLIFKCLHPCYVDVDTNYMDTRPKRGNGNRPFEDDKCRKSAERRNCIVSLSRKISNYKASYSNDTTSV